VSTGDPKNRAEALRIAFDRSFAEAHHEKQQDEEDFLAVRVATKPYAFRVAEVAGLYVDRTIVPVPTRSPALLGVAGFRGKVVPVYDLRILLRLPAATAPRWLVLLSADGVFGLSFDLFEAHLRGASDAVLQSGVARPLLDAASIRAQITKE
jgi:chemotaxis signal transduction protein